MQILAEVNPPPKPARIMISPIQHRNSEYFQTLVIGNIVPLLENREVVVANQLF